jgi:hypothetical protein
VRHSKIDLTLTVYTDPRLLDVRGALDALPALPLRGDRGEAEATWRTGTDALPNRTVAPAAAPTADPSEQNGVNC